MTCHLEPGDLGLSIAPPLSSCVALGRVVQAWAQSRVAEDLQKTEKMLTVTNGVGSVPRQAHLGGRSPGLTTGKCQHQGWNHVVLAVTMFSRLSASHARDFLGQLCCQAMEIWSLSAELLGPPPGRTLFPPPIL